MSADVVALVDDAIAPATRETAERRRDAIRGALEFAVDLLIAAWRERDYEALDYGTGQAGWEAYLDAEYGNLRAFRLPAEPRRERLVLMHKAGMSVRAAAATPGMGSRGQTGEDLKALRAAGRIAADTKVRGMDGREQAARKAAPAELVDEHKPAGALTAVDRVVLAVAAAGTKGATTLDLMRALKWRQGPASAALARAAKRGRVVHAGAWRDGFGVYTVPTPALEQ